MPPGMSSSPILTRRSCSFTSPEYLMPPGTVLRACLRLRPALFLCWGRLGAGGRHHPPYATAPCASELNIGERPFPLTSVKHLGPLVGPHTLSPGPRTGVEVTLADFDPLPHSLPQPTPASSDSDRHASTRIVRKSASLGHPPTSSSIRTPIGWLRAENPAYGTARTFSKIHKPCICRTITLVPRGRMRGQTALRSRL